MPALVAALVVAALVVAGCGGDTTPSATTTVTATATATVTVTATTEATAIPAPADPTSPSPTAPPRLQLTVFEDGCGVIRSESPRGAYVNLTWVFRDTDGFQVLGRVAEGETRYRYFRPGTYTVVLEAFGSLPVSNAVTVHC